jgi:YD repeat-containing protein
VGYANGIQHAYAYDALNRLTGLNVARQAVGNGTPATPVQGYAYTLDPAGRRTGIAELGGRTIANTFDALGRLTSESISSLITDHGSLGTLSYSYDAVGNRLSRTTTGGLTTLLPNQAKAFTANDQLTSDSYDGNGNTTSSLITDH